MTSKRKQIKKIPISIFFSKDQIPKNFKGVRFEEYYSYSIYKSDEGILINLSKISHFNSLQKNYKLLLIGQAIRDLCQSGNFFVDYFGCEKTDIKKLFF